MAVVVVVAVGVAVVAVVVAVVAVVVEAVVVEAVVAVDGLIALSARFLFEVVSYTYVKRCCAGC